MITQDRIDEMEDDFWSESNDEDTQEWREDLTEEETKVVDKWDRKYAQGTVSLCQQILDIEKEKM